MRRLLAEIEIPGASGVGLVVEDLGVGQEVVDILGHPVVSEVLVGFMLLILRILQMEGEEGEAVLAALVAVAVVVERAEEFFFPAIPRMGSQLPALLMLAA